MSDEGRGGEPNEQEPAERGPGLPEAFRGGFTWRLALIALLCLAAQIPLWSVSDLVAERMGSREHAIAEVEAGWGGARRILLPYLEIPVDVIETRGDGTERRTAMYIGLVADHAGLDLRLEPEVRRRGLFDVVLYRTGVTIDGSFRVPDAAEIAGLMARSRVVPRYDEARLVLDMDAAHALEGEVRLDLGDGQAVMAVDQGRIGLEAPAGTIRLVAPVDAQPGRTLRPAIAFVARGSDDLRVVPAATSLDVVARAPWPTPSFLGSRLPVYRDVGEQGFSARWTLSGGNLGVRRASTSSSPAVSDAATDATFGLRLLQPVDTYRMVERAVKYGLLFVVTTFLVYVMFEATGGVAVHIVHYGLVALALCLFYLLLLSLAEIWGFGPAYLVSAGAVLLQTGLFTRAIAGGWRRMATFVAVLGAAYAWLYVLLDLQDMALLGGALGLFVLLSVAMYVLRGLGRGGPVGQPALP